MEGLDLNDVALDFQPDISLVGDANQLELEQVVDLDLDLELLLESTVSTISAISADGGNTAELSVSLEPDARFDYTVEAWNGGSAIHVEIIA